MDLVNHEDYLQFGEVRTSRRTGRLHFDEGSGNIRLYSPFRFTPAAAPVYDFEAIVGVLDHEIRIREIIDSLGFNAIAAQFAAA